MNALTNTSEAKGPENFNSRDMTSLAVHLLGLTARIPNDIFVRFQSYLVHKDQNTENLNNANKTYRTDYVVQVPNL